MSSGDNERSEGYDRVKVKTEKQDNDEDEERDKHVSRHHHRDEKDDRSRHHRDSHHHRDEKDDRSRHHRDSHRERGRDDRDRHHRDGRDRGRDDKDRHHRDSHHSHRDNGNRDKYDRNVKDEKNGSSHRDHSSRKRRREEEEAELKAKNEPEMKKVKVEQIQIPDNLRTVQQQGSVDDKAAKLRELSELFARQKKQLEEQKASLVAMKENNQRMKKEKVEVREVKGIHSGLLRLDEHGRELDAFGNVITNSKTPMPKHATLLANQHRSNKQSAPTISQQIAPRNKYIDPTIKKPSRVKRDFQWVEPGSIVQKAEEIRHEAFLEAEREEARRKEELEIQSSSTVSYLTEAEKKVEVSRLLLEKRNLVAKIPVVEWWDKPFLKGYLKTNEENDQVKEDDEEEEENKERKKPITKEDNKDMMETDKPETKLENGENKPIGYGNDDEDIPIDISSIDSLVIHPVPLEPPAEPPLPAPRPLPVTARERKRLKKQRKQAKRLEEQEKILHGLKKPPPPRVRLANINRVYGTEALIDPTRVEMIVVKETKERLERHEARNQERKLTKRQKQAKKRKKLTEGNKLSIKVCVFKVVQLPTFTPQNEYKVDINAKQLVLTGCCIHLPTFSVVVVEGSTLSLRRFKKLMLRRIKWSNDDYEGDDDGDDDDDDELNRELKRKNKNGCELVWEGELVKCIFPDFQVSSYANEPLAKRFLANKGADHYLDMARNFSGDK